MNTKIYFDTIETAIGSLSLAATDTALCMSAFSDSTFIKGYLSAISKLHGSDIIRKVNPVLAQAAIDLVLYIEGVSEKLNCHGSLSLAPELTPFQRDVLEACGQIPRGSVASYGDLAEAIGKPGAVRAVGTALARNPMVLYYPCHRIVASDGSIGGYAGGRKAKKYLLELEKNV